MDLALGPSGPDLGPDLDLTWDLDLRLIYVYLCSVLWVKEIFWSGFPLMFDVFQAGREGLECHHFFYLIQEVKLYCIIGLQMSFSFGMFVCCMASMKNLEREPVFILGMCIIGKDPLKMFLLLYVTI